MSKCVDQLDLITSTVVASKLRCSNSKVLSAATKLGIDVVYHKSPHGFIMQGFTPKQEQQIVNFLKKKPVTERETKVRQAKQLMKNGSGTLEALRKVGLSWSSFKYSPRHKQQKRDNGLLSTPQLALKLGGWNVGYIRKIAVEIMRLRPAKEELIGGKRKIFYWSVGQFAKIKVFIEARNHTWLKNR